jgi:hypothetical protein
VLLSPESEAMNYFTDPQSRAVRDQIYLLLVVALVAYVGGCTMSEAQPTGSKAGWTAKVAPELITLYDEYSNYLASGKSGVFQSTNSLVQVIDDRVVIDAVASGDATILKTDLESLGIQRAVAFGRVVSGQLPILAISRMATLTSLNFARAASALLQGSGAPVRPGPLTN